MLDPGEVAEHVGWRHARQFSKLAREMRMIGVSSLGGRLRNRFLHSELSRKGGTKAAHARVSLDRQSGRAGKPTLELPNAHSHRTSNLGDSGTAVGEHDVTQRRPDDRIEFHRAGYVLERPTLEDAPTVIAARVPERVHEWKRAGCQARRQRTVYQRCGGHAEHDGGAIGPEPDSPILRPMMHRRDTRVGTGLDADREGRAAGHGDYAERGASVGPDGVLDRRRTMIGGAKSPEGEDDVAKGRGRRRFFILEHRRVIAQGRPTFHHTNMRNFKVLGLSVLVAASAGAQASMAACGPLRDSTSRQQVSSFDSLRVCMLATKVVGKDAETPREWAAKGDVVVLETQRPNDNRRAAIVGSSVEWTINGRQAPMDSLAQAWQSAVVALADASFEADDFRRRVAALRAEIDSLPQKIEATKIRIAYLEKRDRQLNLEILNANNRENAIRTEIRGMESRLATAQSRASAAERQAAAARDDRTRAAAEATARAAQQEVMRLSDAIMRAQRDAFSGESSRKVAAAQEELRVLQPTHNISLLNLQLSNYESIDLADVEAQITQLDAPQRLPALDARVEKARLDLLAVLEARGKAPPR